MKTKIMMMSAMLCLVSFAGTAYAGQPVPDTGQAGSYTTTFGEDPDYTINPPSYTKLGLGGTELGDEATVAEGWIMTRDNVTGLIWEVKTDDDSIHDKDNTYTWCDTNPATNGGDSGTCGDGTDTEDFIAALNAANFGGFSDWRVPTRRELRTIVIYEAFDYDPTIDEDFFPNSGRNYWTSDTRLNDTSKAWRMSFYDGNNYDYYKFIDIFVRAVRGGQSQSEAESRFIDNENGTVTDTETGLMWQQHDDDVQRFWPDALTYCENSTLAGYDDWRMPTIKDLDSIVDLTRDSSSVYPIFSRPESLYYCYWSSTGRPDNYSMVWYMSFNNGSSNYSHKTANDEYVRAVRGGQNQVSENLVILEPEQGDRLERNIIQTILWETQGISGNVSIFLSRDGGKTFSDTLSASTPNDGSFEWTVSEAGSYNCVLKIIPLDDTGKATTQGLFTISEPEGPAAAPWVPLLLLGE